MTATVPVSRSLKQRLKQVCTELKTYRRSRGISASLLARKAAITRVTLNKLEQGDIGVSVGIWLKVLSVLESTDKFFDLLSTAVTKKSVSKPNIKKETSSSTKNKKSRSITKSKSNSKSKIKTRSTTKSSSKLKTKKSSSTQIKSKPKAKNKARSLPRSKAKKKTRR